MYTSTDSTCSTYQLHINSVLFYIIFNEKKIIAQNIDDKLWMYYSPGETWRQVSLQMHNLSNKMRNDKLTDASK